MKRRKGEKEKKGRGRDKQKDGEAWNLTRKKKR